jgi:hypothetical protein
MLWFPSICSYEMGIKRSMMQHFQGEHLEHARTSLLALILLQVRATMFSHGWLKIIWFA